MWTESIKHPIPSCGLSGLCKPRTLPNSTKRIESSRQMAVISKRVDQRGNFQGIFDLQGSSVSAVPPPLPQCKHAWNGSARHPSLSVLKDPDLVEVSPGFVCAPPHWHSHASFCRRSVVICALLCVQFEQLCTAVPVPTRAEAIDADFICSSFPHVGAAFGCTVAHSCTLTEFE